jgi:hypothetical protein
MAVVVFVGTLPHTVGAMFSPKSINEMVHMSALHPCEMSIGYMKKAAKRIGREKVMAIYESKYEWKSLYTLWSRESRWDYTANNPTSSAYGIPQMLNMSEDTPMVRQIDLGLKYIEARYGSPSKALAFHNRNGWY